MVRVKAETRQRLDKAKARYMAGCETGQRTAEIDHRNDEPSVDWVIRQLLDMLDKQQAREDKARAKRKETVISADQPIA